MKAAAKQLEFERAAALRDEIQQIRLRVLEEDASIIVGRAAERGRRAGADGRGLTGAADRARGRRGAAASRRGRPGVIEVTSVDGPAGRRGARRRPWTASRATATSTDGHGRRLAARHPRRARGRRPAGRRAGSTGRPGTARSRPTSSSGPARGRPVAADQVAGAVSHRRLAGVASRPTGSAVQSCMVRKRRT